MKVWSSGYAMTPAFLKEVYLKLNQDYFGPSVVLDEEIAVEWARIPHFYYNFYVYQYATGISAAHALAQTVLTQGPEHYLNFLSAGGSGFPLDILKQAGIDMRGPEPTTALIHHFANLTQQLEKVLLGNPNESIKVQN